MILVLQLPLIVKQGERLIYRGNVKLDCDICPDDSYQPEENYSQYCKPCTRCDDGKC